MFNFYSLIVKYGVWFECVTTEKGGYVDGEWQDGKEKTVPCFGAIVSLPERKLYQPGGTYSMQDRNLYLPEPLPAHWKNCTVRHDGSQYRIEEDISNGNETFTGVYSYVLKWVSVFDPDAKD